MRAFPLSSAPKSNQDWKKESGLLADGFMKMSIRCNCSTVYLVDITKLKNTCFRLIDLCANLMAAENTCHHSDHSLGRCLVYGAHVCHVYLFNV
jgi:hypothetical protein